VAMMRLMRRRPDAAKNLNRADSEKILLQEGVLPWQSR
jgi:hypothetical protein